MHAAREAVLDFVEPNLREGGRRREMEVRLCEVAGGELGGGAAEAVHEQLRHIRKVVRRAGWTGVSVYAVRGGH